MSEDGASIAVRPIEPSDVDRVAALAAQLGYPATVERMRDRLRGVAGDAEHAVFVATDATGEVIGWIHLFVQRTLVSDRETEIGALIVDDRRRGRGVGRALVEHGAEWARERESVGIRVRSNVARDGSHRFYAALGYETAKTQHVHRKRL
jgi:predicted N-acetyltransferase YhbS